MKVATLAKAATLAAAVALTFAQSAQARASHQRHRALHATRHFASARHRSAPQYFDAAAGGFAWQGQDVARAGDRSAPRYFDSAPNAVAWRGQNAAYGGYGGRPRAWCGWEMRHLVDHDPGPQYNLARNWAHWGHAGPAGIGAIVVWAHHVGKIVGQENGTWVIQSGNDGNRVRTRPLSISHAIAIRWS